MIEKVCNVQPAEVFGEWLKHDYSGWGDIRTRVDTAFPGSSHFITLPDYRDHQSNQRRAEILRNLTGDILRAIPEDTEWTISKVDQQSFRELLLIDSGTWRQLSGGSLRAFEVAGKIDSDPAVCRGQHARPIRYILDNLERLAKDPSRIIAVGPEQGPIVVIDGVHRTVAITLFYLIRNVEEFQPREIYLGRLGSAYNMSFI